jgi:hypothetical protein
MTSFFDRESIQIGKDRIHVLVGKVDLRHRPVFGNHAFPEFCLQFSRRKPRVDIAHRRGLLERTLTDSFDGMTATAVFLKENLTSDPELAGVGGI